MWLKIRKVKQSATFIKNTYGSMNAQQRRTLQKDDK